MYELIIALFVIGYLCIALEHNIHLDKAATALITGGVIWGVIALNASSLIDIQTNFSYQAYKETVSNPSILDFITHYSVGHHLIEIGSILFFLFGAITIVEIVDYHGGFSVITNMVKTRNKRKLLWILGVITFFMSALLDNLTTSIVLIALLKKIIEDKHTRWYFASMVIIAANAGGAWSPIGDVTTIMLWIGGQVTAVSIIKAIILPSLVTLVVALGLFSIILKGEIEATEIKINNDLNQRERNIVFFMGGAALLFVPVFKSVTHLPPFIGMLLGLGMLWAVTTFLHLKKSPNIRKKYSVNNILTKIDTPTILFFLGILLAVGGLQTTGHLTDMAQALNELPVLGEQKVYGIGIIIGILSAIVDNVPLVAAAMGMYPVTPENATGFMEYFTQDGLFWEFLAYCAGTGGSILIIGSAAGVAIMGIDKINFIWYLKKISLIALASYLSGAFCYILF